jgi:NADP-dependent 3-hydroxy acid dehydrogenase YdfG
MSEVQTDVAEYCGVEELWDTMNADGRPVQALALNAGVGLGGDFARDQSLDEALRLIRVNVESTVHLAKRVLPVMADRGEGEVLFSSSIASESPRPYQALYNARKCFVQSFAEAIADDSGASLFGYTKLYGQVPGGQAEYLRVPRVTSRKGPFELLVQSCFFFRSLGFLFKLGIVAVGLACRLF